MFFKHFFFTALITAQKYCTLHLVPTTLNIKHYNVNSNANNPEPKLGIELLYSHVG